jgi:hypothetical protein
LRISGRLGGGTTGRATSLMTREAFDVVLFIASVLLDIFTLSLVIKAPAAAPLSGERMRKFAATKKPMLTILTRAYAIFLCPGIFSHEIPAPANFNPALRSHSAPTTHAARVLVAESMTPDPEDKKIYKESKSEQRFLYTYT